MLTAPMGSRPSAEAVYRAYSAVAHGQIYGLMNFMTPEGQSDSSGHLVWQLPGAVLDSTVQLAILAFREPYHRIRQVMGWGRLEDDVWSSKLGKIFNSGLRAA